MNQSDEIKSIGKWHLGHQYNTVSGFFKVREEKESEDGTYYEDRLLSVNENSLLLFEPDQINSGMAKLISVATLCSLEKIVRNLDMPDSATFIWRKIDKQEQWVLKLEI